MLTVSPVLRDKLGPARFPENPGLYRNLGQKLFSGDHGDLGLPKIFLIAGNQVGDAVGQGGMVLNGNLEIAEGRVKGLGNDRVSTG